MVYAGKTIHTSIHLTDWTGDKKVMQRFSQKHFLFTIQITDHNQPFNMIANLWQLTNLSVKLFINQ